MAASEPSGSFEARAFLIVALVLTAILLLLVAVLWQSRLVLTHEGIAHH